MNTPRDFAANQRNNPPVFSWAGEARPADPVAFIAECFITGQVPPTDAGGAATSEQTLSVCPDNAERKVQDFTAIAVHKLPKLR